MARAFFVNTRRLCRKKLEYERAELQAHAAAVQAEEQEARSALCDVRTRLEAVERQRNAAEVRCGLEHT